MKTHLYKFTILFLVLLFSGYNVLAQVPNYVPTNGLVGYWPFNGNANDASGNGNNGNVLGANLTTDENGNANSAYNFNYTGMQWNAGLHQTINIPYNSSFNSNTISVSIWFYARSYFFPGIPGNDKVSRLVTRFQDGYNNPNGQTWGLELSNNQLSAFVLQASSANNQNSVVSSTNISLNEWHHVTFTFDNISLKLYLNGILVSETQKPPTFSLNTNGSSGLSVGCSNQANGYWYESDAKIDKLGFWNRALTQQEISALHTSNAVSTALTCSITTSDSTLCLGQSTTLSVGNTPPSSTNCGTLTGSLANGLVGYWPFCGNANDLSGNGNNGTVNGATLTTDRFGNANSAYSFDGVNDYIRIINSPTLNNASVAISGWFNTNNLPIDDGIYAKGIIGKWWQSSSICNSNYNSYLLCLTKPSGLQNTFLGAATDYYAGNNFYTSTTISTNNWYHFTFIHNSTTGGSLYINGNLINSNSISGSICNSINDLIMGADISNGNVYRFFNGKLDDIGIWNRALSPSEIQQLYTQGQSTYSWSPGGATTPTITVSPTQTTTYTVTTTVNGVSCSDSITVTVDSLNFSLPPTTTVCGTTTTLTAPAGATSYLWNTGTTTAAISPTTSGFYSCIVTKGACVERDTTQVTLVNSTITTTDSTLCLGQSTTLSVGSTPSSSSTNCGTLTGSLANGLVGYWPFCGNANDLSGNGNNGTVNGATLTTNRFGNANSAYSFDGVNDYIEVLNSQSLSNSIVITNSIWVYFNDWNLSNSNWFATIEKPGQYSLQLNRITNNSASLYGVTIPVLSNQWNNIIFSLENGIVKIYSNGVFCGSNLVSVISSNNSFFFGMDPGGVTEFLNGKLDDIAIWNRSLTPSEIQQLYTQNQSTYSWSPGGATTPTITVSPTQTTTYTVTTTVNGVSCSDSITVTVDSLNFSLPPTTTVCGTTTTLSAPTGATSYLWNTGATTAAISPTTSGSYSCIVTKGACVKRDTTQVTLVNSTITTTDSTLCLGQSTTLSVGSTPSSSSTNCGTLTGSLANGLVGYWPFCGNANDLSGNGNNGTVNGATLTTDRFGNANNAYSFDGVNDKIFAANTSSLNPNQIAVSVWINPTAFGPSEQYIINKSIDLNPGSVNRSWAIRLSGSGQLSLEIRVNNTYYNYQSTSTLTLNQWNNIVYTYDGSVAKLFNNNVNIINQILPGTLSNFNYDLSFGYFPHSNMPPYGYFLNGKLDDIGIWNRSLTSSEIQQLYSQGQSTYSWSPGGATTPTITVSPTQTTTYTVTTTVNGVSCSDSITVTVDSLNFSLPPTTTVCGTTTTLSAPTGATSYLWNTGAITAAISPTTSGSYSCQVTQGACSVSDTTQLTIMDPSISASDTLICLGQNTTLSVNNINLTTPCNLAITPSSIPLGQPKPGFTFAGVFNNHYYYVYNSPTSWTQGELICRQNGGYLACINDAAEDAYVTSLTTNNIWIGLFRNSQTCSFEWLDCSTVNYTNWRPGEPNNDPCGEPYGQIIKGCSFGLNTWNNLDNNPFGNGPCYSNMYPILEIDPQFQQGNTSILWSNGATTPTITVSPTQTTTYTVTTTVNGVSCSDSLTIVVDTALAVVTLSGPTTFCASDSLQLTANPGSSYQWSTNETTQSITVNQSGTYSVIVTNASGCTAYSTNTVVTVQPLPVVFAGNDTSICFADTLTLVGSGATSYSWNAGVSNGIAFVLTSSATYTLTGTNANGCVNTDQINITVNPLPTINAGADQFVCIGASATLQAVGGVSYSWNNGISDNTPFTPTNTLNYTVTGTDINGCVNTDQVTVTVNPLPNVSAGQDQALCLGTSLSLIGSGAATYSWNNGVINNNLFSPTATTTYTVTGTDINGCVNSDQVVVTVHPLPIVSAGNDTTVCAGEPLVFSGSGAGFYLWNNGITNATTFSATTTSAFVVTGIDNNNCIDTDTLQLIVEPLPVISASPDIQICAGELVTLSATSNGTIQWNNGVIDNTPFQPTTTSVYTVSSLGTNGCENTEQVLVTVNPLPNANFNTPYFSQGSPNTTFNFTNTSTNSDQVVWDFGDGVGSSTMNNPMYTYPLVSGTYPVTLIVVSDFGCTDTVMKIVRVINNSISSEVIIPTGFSPNNDGANDTWTITGLANYPQASINVFNRWGQKIFEGNSTNYSWDGTFNNQLQPVADYYYIIELNDATKYNGIVTLKY